MYNEINAHTTIGECGFVFLTPEGRCKIVFEFQGRGTYLGVLRDTMVLACEEVLISINISFYWSKHNTKCLFIHKQRDVRAEQ